MPQNFEVFTRLNSETKNLFSLIQKAGPITKNHLSHLTGLKLSTLIRYMQPLEEMGLIIQSSIGDSTGGRKPALFDVNKYKYFIVGVDLSRTYTKLVITNLKMDILAERQFPMDKSSSPEKTVDLISKLIGSTANYLKIDPKKLIGIGIGTVGPLNRSSGVMINPANFEAPGWSNVPFKAMLADKTGLPVIIDNGANAAVLAETLFGAGKGLKDVVYLNCGIGIRTGVISSGTIVRTINDAEDAFGHMVIDVDGEACICGNFGCIETYSSIVSIMKRFVLEIKKGKKTGISKQPVTINYVDICNAAEHNDDLSKEIISKAAAILGTGLANFINLLNPTLVILSGPLVNHSKIFYNTCTYVAMQKCYIKKTKKNIFMRSGKFNENAIAVGAAVLFIENCLNSSILGY